MYARDCFAYLLNQFYGFLLTHMTVHCIEHMVGDMLQSNIKILTDIRLFTNDIKQFQRELIGICVMKTYPLDSLDIGHITDKVSNMPLSVNINSIVSKFLCNDLELLNTITHKLSYFL